MINFTLKSDCGKYQIVLAISEAATQAQETKPVPLPVEVPVLAAPPKASTIVPIRSIEPYEVPAEYEKRVKAMWTEGTPYEPYDTKAEVHRFRKINGSDSLSHSQTLALTEMRKTNARIYKLKQEKVEYCMKKDAEKAAAAGVEIVETSWQKLKRIRAEESDKERAIIAKEGVSLKRLRNPIIQSV